MNNSQMTSQQKELKERLEEIRKKRNAESAPRQNTNKQTPKRNEGSQRKDPQKKTQPSLSPTPSLQKERVKKEISASKPKKRPAPIESKKSRSKKKNDLVKQLTNADSLKDAIILNEVVSKPIALRNRNR